MTFPTNPTAAARPMFPHTIDSTILASFRACPQKAFRQYIEHWKPRETSVHLVAGGAFAAGIEAARNSFYVENSTAANAEAAGLVALIRHYGDFQCPSDSAKSLDRMCGALEFYFAQYPLGSDGAEPITLPSGRRGIEFSFAEPLPADEFEAKTLEFTKRLVEGMGYACEVAVLFREEKKLGVRIDSEHASIIIGKKGKNLDALQLLVNVFAGRLGREDTRVILDSENYRIRREESLVRLAYETAEDVRRKRQSVLLEPMNPFERRIIHTTLNDIVDIETKSEGEGLYKQVRVFFRGRP